MDSGHLSGKGTQVRASVTLRLKRAPAAGLEGEIMHIALSWIKANLMKCKVNLIWWKAMLNLFKFSDVLKF